jgi:hypothetical protein
MFQVNQLTNIHPDAPVIEMPAVGPGWGSGLGPAADPAVGPGGDPGGDPAADPAVGPGGVPAVGPRPL